MVECMLDEYRAVLLMFFSSLSPGGCIDRDKPITKTKFCHDITGSKISLDQDEITLLGCIGEPLLNRNQQREQGLGICW